MARNERAIYLKRHTSDLMFALVTRNNAGASKAMDNIVGKYGAPGVLTACRTVAETARQITFPGVERGDGTLTGPIMVIERLPEVKVGPDALWAARFFTAHANGDDDTLSALFLADYKEDPSRHAGRVATLLKMCAHLIRQV